MRKRNKDILGDFQSDLSEWRAKMSLKILYIFVNFQSFCDLQDLFLKCKPDFFILFSFVNLQLHLWK